MLLMVLPLVIGILVFLVGLIMLAKVCYKNEHKEFFNER